MRYRNDQTGLTSQIIRLISIISLNLKFSIFEGKWLSMLSKSMSFLLKLTFVRSFRKILTFLERLIFEKYHISNMILPFVKLQTVRACRAVLWHSGQFPDTQTVKRQSGPLSNYFLWLLLVSRPQNFWALTFKA